MGVFGEFTCVAADTGNLDSEPQSRAWLSHSLQNHSQIEGHGLFPAQGGCKQAAVNTCVVSLCDCRIGFFKINFCWGVNVDTSVLHRLMCPRALSIASGALWGGCEVFGTGLVSRSDYREWTLTVISTSCSCPSSVPKPSLCEGPPWQALAAAHSAGS